MNTMKFAFTIITLFISPTLSSAQNSQRPPIILEDNSEMKTRLLKQARALRNDGHAVSIEEVERVERKGQVVQLPMHKFSSIIPSNLSKLVLEQTAINCENVGVCATARNARTTFGAVTILGDRYSGKGVRNVGSGETKYDFDCKFRPMVPRASESSFTATGAFQFHNKLTGAKCYLLCRITGDRKEGSELSGKAEWLGPLNEQEDSLAKTLSSFFELNQTSSKSRDITGR